MRHIIRRITLLAAALMIMAVPVLADDGQLRPGMEPEGKSGKNECLLVAMNCDNLVTLNEEARVNRIQNEISRGTDVYTKDELKILKDRLDDANRSLNESRGGGV